MAKSADEAKEITEDDEHIKKLLDMAWENFKTMMKEQEIEKNILEKLYMQQNQLKGSLDMAERMISKNEFGMASNYLKQAEDHHAVLEKFEVLLKTAEEQAKTTEKRGIKNISSMIRYSRDIKNRIEELRKRIEKNLSKAA